MGTRTPNSAAESVKGQASKESLGAGQVERKDMAEKKAGKIIQDGESVASRRSAHLPGPNGNRVGTRQLPSVYEPTLDEPEADGVNTAHEDEGQEAKNTPAPPSVRSKRRLLFAVIGVVLLIGAVVGARGLAAVELHRRVSHHVNCRTRGGGRLGVDAQRSCGGLDTAQGAEFRAVEHPLFHCLLHPLLLHPPR